MIKLILNISFIMFKMGFPNNSADKDSACDSGDTGNSSSIPGLGRCPREGNGNPLQYCCLENPMVRAAWWATVDGVTKSRMQLRDFYSLAHTRGHVYGAVIDSVIAIL